MARQTGTFSTANGSRKRITQPVLPALPLIPKIKPQTTKVDKSEDEITNGTENELSTALKPVAEIQTIVSTSAQSTRGEETQDVEQNSLPESESVGSKEHEKYVDHNAVHECDEAIIQIHDEQRFAGPHRRATPKAEEIDAALNKPVQALLDTESFSPSQENVHDPVTDISNGDSENDSFPRTGTASDAIRHASLIPVSHSTHPSISNSSIQHTPKNGISTPVSFDSNKTMPQSVHVNGKHQPTPDSFVNGNISPTPFSGAATDTLSSPANRQGFPTLVDHIRNLAFSPEWYDSELCVYFQSPKPVIYRNAHSLVLIRSERLRTFLYPQRASSYSYFIINLCPIRPINSNAFDAALRFLYADTILSAERLLPANTYMDRSAKVNALDYVISYIVAGLELGIEPVVTRGLDLIGRLLDWDIVELTAREAALLQSAPPPAMNPHTPPDTRLAAKLIYQHIFNLVVLRLDVHNFKLDTVTGAVDMLTRFAQLEPSRSVNPALANMVFGSMPATAILSPSSSHESSPQSGSSPNSIASTIMLNLEFDELFGLSNSLIRAHNTHGARVIREVVEERERRRLHVLHSHTTSTKQRLANSAAWDVVGWREYVDENDILRRERVGFLVPNKRNPNTN